MWYAVIFTTDDGENCWEIVLGIYESEELAQDKISRDLKQRTWAKKDDYEVKYFGINEDWE